MVVDCGTTTWAKSDEIGERLTARYLQSLGVDTIDVVVLTHPHLDHVSGMAGLIGTKPARMVIDIGVRHRGSAYKAFLQSAQACGAVYRIAKRGQIIDFGDGVISEILNPHPVDNYHDLNNHSIAMRITYKDVAFLLAGDTEEEAESKMLASCDRLDAQVLQVGHHGGADSCTPAFLARVRPTVAVISCGRHNEHGHPSREVLARLEAIGARVYRTDRDGAVIFTTNGKSVSIRTFGSNR